MVGRLVTGNLSPGFSFFLTSVLIYFVAFATQQAISKSQVFSPLHPQWWKQGLVYSNSEFFFEWTNKWRTSYGKQVTLKDTNLQLVGVTWTHLGVMGSKYWINREKRPVASLIEPVWAAIFFQGLSLKRQVEFPEFTKEDVEGIPDSPVWSF